MAVGALGMSLDDFDSLLPAELSEIIEQWRRERHRADVSRLAELRLHAAILIQTQCKDRIKPVDLFPIPEIDGESEAPVKISREEARRRYEELKHAISHE